MSHHPGLLNSLGGEMNFAMQRVDYDPHRGRAYVEFREPDGDGGDAIATTIFSYRTRDKLTKKQVHEEIVRKARHLLRRAAAAT
jgi:hypothetical protein